MKRDRSRNKAFTRRAALLAGGQAALLAVLVGRLYDLQVVQSPQYKMLADENRINLRLLPPRRGRILDRFGVELANNRRNYRVVLVPEETNDVEGTLNALAGLIPLSDHERRKVMREVARNRPFVPVTAVENLSWEEFARVNVHTPDLPGIQPEVGESRHYPLGEPFGHVVGYVAAVADDELTGDPLLELPGFRIGKSGIEKTYDLALRGTAGNSQVEVNAFGRVIRELARDDGEAGADTVLTIDADLQRMVYGRLEGESGAVAVLDVHSGEVLALVSVPGFDPNVFNLGLSQETWHSLLQDPKTPLINKAIAGQYPPGSTFKMIVGLAALEAGIISPSHSVVCTGSVQLGNHKFHCWKRGGHGRVDLGQAFERSCDSFFYDVARRVGVNRIAEMAERFGLGRASDIELPSESGGLIPTKEWKQAIRSEPWQQGETLVTGIGQGFVLTTPLQLAVMTARIANGGIAIQPRLVRAAADEDQTAEAAEARPTVGVSDASLSVIRAGMARVTGAPTGTAYRSRIVEPEYAMAGKTGTSQVRRITKRERLGGIRKNQEKPWVERDHALFVAYAPVEAPRYAIAVIIEHGSSGSKAAAPIARDILLEVQRRDPVGRLVDRPSRSVRATDSG